MTKQAELAGGKPCVGVAGKFYVVYLPEGGTVQLSGLVRTLPCRWFEPKTAKSTDGGKTGATTTELRAPSSEPWVLFLGEPRKK